MANNNTSLSLNGTQLKWIACLTMLIDHMGMLLFPQHDFLRLIGRLAFPIFAYNIALGYRHTRSLSKYLLRLAIFALLYEPIYRICVGHSWSILFTLTAGLAAIAAWDILGRRSGSRIPAGAAVLAIMLLSAYFNFDYGAYGVAMIFTAYLFQEDYRLLSISWLVVNLLYTLPYLPLVSTQFLCLLSLPLLGLYNGQRGKGSRWSFYIFYALHLPLLYLLKTLI